MKNKITLPLLLMTAIITACSSNISPVIKSNGINHIAKSEKTFLSNAEYFQLEKEYGQFKTESFSKDYLKKKLNKWKNMGSQGEDGLIREIEFSRIKQPTLYCSVMSENSDIKNYINANSSTNLTKLLARKTSQESFGAFLDTGCSPDFVTSGLVLNLDAGQTDSYPSPFTGTTWFDLSSSHNNGTLTNEVGYSSANHGSLVFDGINDYVAVVSSLNTSGNYSVSLWFNQSSLINTGIIETGSIGYTRSTGPILLVWANAGTLYTYGEGIGSYGLIDTYSANTWYNLTITRTATAENTYLNGVLKLANKPVITINPVGATNSQLNIGVGYQGYFNGNISSVLVYNRTLSSTEVQQNYDAIKGRY